MSQSFDPRTGYDENGVMAPKAYDAILLASFGGPEGQDDVIPFLRNVTKGRGIPDERLEEVATHYRANGGISPINAQNRALKAALEAELAARDINVPLYWGNRNWAPYVAETITEIHAAGHRTVLMLSTSAYSGYSSCRQYREDLGVALRETGLEGKLEVDKVRQYFDTPAFVNPFVEGLRDSLANVRAQLAEAGNPDGEIKIVFVTHSIPTSDAEAAGPRDLVAELKTDLYSTQHLAVADAILAEVPQAAGLEHSLVFQSRSGSPHVPWLEPDINDALAQYKADGVAGVVVVPIGFVSDHMEVLWDLDTEAKDSCAELGLAFHRVPTPGTHTDFVSGMVDLLAERLAGSDGNALKAGRASVAALGPWFDVCRPNCCAKVMRDGTVKPTIAAVDSEVGVPEA
ncbi:ferrochelatase [Paeniglutamicibacter gangotriensis]|uniref:Coproporphyrin III ferrochelatase n=2 Tax=Paeniglutamicibacter gangotriensis TaxID=254787 RepID=M7MX81_9MICC|nr:ferrochelatase [Paeniglutamicibacter gangotriensis]EMQ99666.1 ferrochelatase [Paeniglutamicibacter gangotriensis Lz1y]KAA0978000.1 ferrochelatase [Paeniglutamicibacter gangotriensis]